MDSGQRDSFQGGRTGAVFICPAQEPGRSGVGDYTLRLAQALREDGVRCHTVSLCETGGRDARAEGADAGESLRLLAAESWESRVQRLQHYIADVGPSLVSLQFVTYGYHPKGLPFGLARRLVKACHGARFELMFHELWCGGRGARLRDRVYGFLQRRMIRDMVRQLKPAVIHTHATPYLEALRGEGWNVLQLPLFSNIRMVEPWSREEFASWLANRSAIQDAAARTIFCLFGSLHPEWQPASLLPLLREHLELSGRKGLLLSIGRRGGDGVWKFLEKQGDERLRCLDLGPLPEADISQCLHASEYGVATTPPDLIEKSGTAIAMFEHGLPVLASRPPVYGEAMARRVSSVMPLLVQGEALRHFASVPKRPPGFQHLAQVASQFAKDAGLGSHPSQSL